MMIMKKLIQLLKLPENFTGEKVVFVYHNMEILVEKDKEGNPIPEYNKISTYFDLEGSLVPIGIMGGVYYSALNIDDKRDIPDTTKFINVRHL